MRLFVDGFEGKKFAVKERRLFVINSVVKVLKKQFLRLLAGLIRLVCGVRPVADAFPPGPKLFYANHTSHLDFTLIWAVLPMEERQLTRPVAGRDYWNRNRITRFVGCNIFNALLIERLHITRSNNPVSQMKAVSEAGFSMIVFPEGTRGKETIPANFKSGLYHFAEACPEVPLIPVYLENLNRMLPKGTFLPVPLISRIRFGKPLQQRVDQVTRETFLKSARAAIIELSK